MSAALTLLGVNVRAWFGTRGFALVAAAALVPMLLTGAWVATHQADVGIDDAQWADGDLRDGDVGNLTALVHNLGDDVVGTFDATLRIDRVSVNPLTQQPRYEPVATNATTFDGLAAGDSGTLGLTWTAVAGVYVVVTEVDPDDDLPEIEEQNNYRYKALNVRQRVPAADEAPTAPPELGGNATANATSDLRIESLTRFPENPGPGENVTFNVTVRNVGPDALANGTAALRVGRHTGSSDLAVLRENTVTLGLAPNETRNLTLTWTAQPGVYWAEAYAGAGDEAHDPESGDNHAAEALTVDFAIQVEQPPVPDRATIKDFYVQVLSLLHLRLLVPFIALFYAGGVLSDERERGNLTYLLTRPLDRWVIPLTKFAAGYAVAALALALGIVATFALLFGTTPQGDVGFLTTPLLVSLLGLLVYGAFFTLLGVLVERPYLIGGALVLGWETLAASLVPWVSKLTLSHHLGEAIANWKLDQGIQWLPEGDAAIGSLRNVLLAGVAFLALAAAAMKRKEFEV